MRKVMRVVHRADRSPLNPRRWCLTLSCGHEIWITSTRRPTRVEAACSRCQEQQEAGQDDVSDDGIPEGYRSGMLDRERRTDPELVRGYDDSSACGGEPD